VERRSCDGGGGCGRWVEQSDVWEARGPVYGGATTCAYRGMKVERPELHCRSLPGDLTTAAHSGMFVRSEVKHGE
jgi:hypothetical protein